MTGRTMTILKRGNSKYWYVQFQVGGQTIIRSTRTMHKKTAEQIEGQLRAQVHARRYLGQKPAITLEQTLDGFVAARQNTPNHRNLVGHKRALLAVMRGSKRLDEVTSEEIEEFRRNRAAEGVAAQTLQHGINLLRSACKLAKRQGYSVPDLNFPNAKIAKHRVRYLSVDEEQQFLRELNPQREARGLPPLGNRTKQMNRALQDAYDLVVAGWTVIGWIGTLIWATRSERSTENGKVEFDLRREHTTNVKRSTDPSQASPSRSKSGVADNLAQIAGLHASGALTDEEFEQLKAKLVYGT